MFILLLTVIFSFPQPTYRGVDRFTEHDLYKTYGLSFNGEPYNKEYPFNELNFRKFCVKLATLYTIYLNEPSYQNKHMIFSRMDHLSRSEQKLLIGFFDKNIDRLYNKLENNQLVEKQEFANRTFNQRIKKIVKVKSNTDKEKEAEKNFQQKINELQEKLRNLQSKRREEARNKQQNLGLSNNGVSVGNNNEDEDDVIVEEVDVSVEKVSSVSKKEDDSDLEEAVSAPESENVCESKDDSTPVETVLPNTVTNSTEETTVSASESENVSESKDDSTPVETRTDSLPMTVTNATEETTVSVSESESVSESKDDSTPVEELSDFSEEEMSFSVETDTADIEEEVISAPNNEIVPVETTDSDSEEVTNAPEEKVIELAEGSDSEEVIHVIEKNISTPVETLNNLSPNTETSTPVKTTAIISENEKEFKFENDSQPVEIVFNVTLKSTESDLEEKNVTEAKDDSDSEEVIDVLEKDDSTPVETATSSTEETTVNAFESENVSKSNDDSATITPPVLTDEFEEVTSVDVNKEAISLSLTDEEENVPVLKTDIPNVENSSEEDSMPSSVSVSESINDKFAIEDSNVPSGTEEAVKISLSEKKDENVIPVRTNSLSEEYLNNDESGEEKDNNDDLSESEIVSTIADNSKEDNINITMNVTPSTDISEMPIEDDQDAEISFDELAKEEIRRLNSGELNKAFEEMVENLETTPNSSPEPIISKNENLQVTFNKTE